MTARMPIAFARRMAPREKLDHPTKISAGKRRLRADRSNMSDKNGWGLIRSRKGPGNLRQARSSISFRGAELILSLGTPAFTAKERG